MRPDHSRGAIVCNGARVHRWEVVMRTRFVTRTFGSLFLAPLFAAAGAAAQTYQVVHSFVDSEGSDPQSGIVQMHDGDFAGTTVGGIGTLFQMDGSGRLHTLYRFTGSDG